MKLLRVGEPNNEIVAVLDNNKKLRDLSGNIKDLNPKTLNENTLKKLQEIDLSKLKEIDDNLRIGSCISNPVDFLAIGLNYKAHAEGTNSKLPTEPILFNKSSGCIQGPNDPIIKPKAANKMDYEVEVALVIGKEGREIAQDKAQDYIFGYCIVNDISERSWQKERGGQWIKGKSIAGPCGPYLVTRDEINDINNINLSLDVNGERRQTGNTKRMIFSFDFLISHISQFMTLYPGTIITTGTPAGTAMEMSKPMFLQNGDKLNLKVDFLGEQNQLIIEQN
ncbi:fumarylacetoacetate hydrolase family protein [Pelagibacteraceae bacterium]|nr:fumarylacetoacetate hydrolase family protein [Pelagibacteraceae bacterium]